MADAIYSKVAEFMTDSVVFTPKASVDKYNKPTFGASDTNVTATGRLIYDTIKSKDVQGTEVVDIGPAVGVRSFYTAYRYCHDRQGGCRRRGCE